MRLSLSVALALALSHAWGPSAGRSSARRPAPSFDDLDAAFGVGGKRRASDAELGAADGARGFYGRKGARGAAGAAGEPPQVLRRFAKVNLAPGECAPVAFELGDADVSVWDADAHGWRKVAGQYGVLVGSSSLDIRLQGTLVVS